MPDSCLTRQTVWRQRGRDTFARKIQLNIQFISPWAVNSNTRGDELDLVTPFAGEFRLLTSATPPPTEFPCPGANLVYNVASYYFVSLKIITHMNRVLGKKSHVPIKMSV